jgi:hypothetical protein
MVEVRLGGYGVGTLGDGSALAAVRADGWPAVRVGWLQVLAALAGTGDVATTYVILSGEAYVEYNATLTALADDALVLALAYFLALNAWYLGLSMLDLGWVSTASGSYQAALMGSSTVNNLVLFAVGTSLLDVLGGSLAHDVQMWMALLIAVALAVHHHERLPVPELLGVGVAFTAGMALA